MPYYLNKIIRYHGNQQWLQCRLEHTRKASKHFSIEIESNGKVWVNNNSTKDYEIKVYVWELMVARDMDEADDEDWSDKTAVSFELNGGRAHPAFDISGEAFGIWIEIDAKII